MTPEELLKSDKVIFTCRSGSFAYGTNTEKSDEDIRGIFYQPLGEVAGLNKIDQQISDTKNDITYYSLRRYIELACEANPNILELLYMPEDCIHQTSPTFEMLKEKRSMFISKKCITTHHAYAMAQIKKARGRNKWINNPQPEERPSLEDFAWFISVNENSEMPARPVKFRKSGLVHVNLRSSSVEHCPGLYRLYKGMSDKPLFKDNSILCSSISKNDESSDFKGLMYVNTDAYKRALTDHKNYWSWIKNRNDNRWELQEKGTLDYDAKNMQHTIRLIMSAENIVNEGGPLVRLEGEKLNLLREIREGKYSYNELIEMAETISARLESKAQTCNLPEEVDLSKASALFLELTELAQKS